MTVQTMWMRENMFGPVGQVYERRFTEAELKVQKSLQKLSIPSWFLNRSTPPKIIKDFIPIERRTSTWKNSNSYKYSDSKKAADNVEQNAEYGRNSDDSGTYEIIEDVEGTTQKTKEDATSLNTKNCEDQGQLDTEIPRVKLKKVSETYPRISPSRKIQNINIVFSRSPKFDYFKPSREILERNDPLENTKSSPIKPRDPEEEIEQNTPRKCCGKTVLPKPLASKTDSPILRTPDTKASFKIRSFSTPDGSPVSLFSSTLMDEDSLNSSRRSSIVSSNFHHNCADHRRKKICPIDVNTAKRKLQTLKYLLSRREELLRCKRASMMAARHSPKENITMTFSVSSSEENYRSDSDRSELACDKLLSSRRKSTELEKIVKNSPSFRSERGFVRSMVDELNRKEKSSSSKNVRQVPDLNQTFVKMAVDALENGNASKARQILFEKGRIKDEDTETESSSDSDVKSATSSMSFSIRDSDSNSSSDLESTSSPMLRNNQERRFSYDVNDIKEITANDSKKKKKEEVHWIPVLFCKICPSAWGKTYTKTRGPSRKLFPIDETAVTDSGYSEEYDFCNTTFTN